MLQRSSSFPALRSLEPGGSFSQQVPSRTEQGDRSACYKLLNMAVRATPKLGKRLGLPLENIFFISQKSTTFSCAPTEGVWLGLGQKGSAQSETHSPEDPEPPSPKPSNHKQRSTAAGRRSQSRRFNQLQQALQRANTLLGWAFGWGWLFERVASRKCCPRCFFPWLHVRMARLRHLASGMAVPKSLCVLFSWSCLSPTELSDGSPESRIATLPSQIKSQASPERPGSWQRRPRRRGHWDAVGLWGRRSICRKVALFIAFLVWALRHEVCATGTGRRHCSAIRQRSQTS